jgi:hypothetical protein
MFSRSTITTKYFPLRSIYLIILLPYAVYIAICFQLINIFYYSFKKCKLFIILEQGGVLCTEAVTKALLVKYPKILVFLPPRSKTRKLVKQIPLKTVWLVTLFRGDTWFVFLLRHP